mmetsp:Transcript_38079/g.92170  ORF Transcript_38079/g.92170 Transcript_38079/m.92170 type:complete len:126 (-) Transcript_38079:161-538(-)|eukprot:CAMPEP_0113644048 /NCGR_PEP_ID=MMETSP0017_2-20120614/23175_1 /TAXON_ID=2856 /ORGANISM="Cylindrotheca closterium" /LENGTH=125 /DNA_ID=CAMNT_0000555623 /DNA_START=35 /DNA_END=412 /DNA_ORIENTATION=+ /assembly_acc=CAM_ASM_000147
MSFTNQNNIFTNTAFTAPTAGHHHHAAPSLTKRRCDSMEEDNDSLHSQEDYNTAPNKRIKSTHQVTGFYYHGQQAASAAFQTPPAPARPAYHQAAPAPQPIQFYSSNESAFFTYGAGATPFQRQP